MSKAVKVPADLVRSAAELISELLGRESRHLKKPSNWNEHQVAADLFACLKGKP